MKKNIPANNTLKIVFVVGIVLALIISLGLIFIFFWGNPIIKAEETFARSLREYDLFDAPRRVFQGENPEQIESQLSNLQRQVFTIEEQLSVLKRRRALAMIDRNYIPAYRRASQQAAQEFPYSTPLAAVAADALVLAPSPLSNEDRALLSDYASRISQIHLGFLELSMHVLAGNLEDPVRASALPWLPQLLSMNFQGLSDQVRRDFQLNDFLLRAHNRDITGASQRLTSLLAEEPDAAGIRRMGAEFFYDHNNPMRAAELFLSLGEETDINRAADALALAGEIPAARNIWLVLSGDNIDRIRLHSYYNLAS